MNNHQKRNIYLYLSVICGFISLAGILVFLYIWVNGFFRLNLEQFLSFQNFMPYWIGTCICAYLFNVFYRNYKRLNSGIKGEEKSQNILTHLPTEYTILSNISIEYNNQKSEIDNLIISPRGIVVVETKNYSGNISGNVEDYEWIQTKVSSKGN